MYFKIYIYFFKDIFKIFQVLFYFLWMKFKIESHDVDDTIGIIISFIFIQGEIQINPSIYQIFISQILYYK